MPYGIITAVKPGSAGPPAVKVMIRDPGTGLLENPKIVYSGDGLSWSKEGYANSRQVVGGTLVFFEIEKFEIGVTSGPKILGFNEEMEIGRYDVPNSSEGEHGEDNVDTPNSSKGEDGKDDVENESNGGDKNSETGDSNSNVEGSDGGDPKIEEDENSNADVNEGSGENSNADVNEDNQTRMVTTENVARGSLIAVEIQGSILSFNDQGYGYILTYTRELALPPELSGAKMYYHASYIATPGYVPVQHDEVSFQVKTSNNRTNPRKDGEKRLEATRIEPNDSGLLSGKVAFWSGLWGKVKHDLTDTTDFFWLEDTPAPSKVTPAVLHSMVHEYSTHPTRYFYYKDEAVRYSKRANKMGNKVVGINGGRLRDFTVTQIMREPNNSNESGSSSNSTGHSNHRKDNGPAGDSAGDKGNGRAGYSTEDYEWYSKQFQKNADLYENQSTSKLTNDQPLEAIPENTKVLTGELRKRQLQLKDSAGEVKLEF